ncbi:chaoptin-like [Cimex lectularius]|uniref:Chaoptin n=1 Tax=Cimex lectularius TaxID=79782 RepID=A0A8I6SLG3_CIMLE|nr:chaoptin-like [Cimex lectularius]
MAAVVECVQYQWLHWLTAKEKAEFQGPRPKRTKAVDGGIGSKTELPGGLQKPSHLWNMKPVLQPITRLLSALESAVKVLRSLDLSFNRLEAVPFGAIAPLATLEWLNLYSNCITSVRGNWGGTTGTVTKMFLGENHLVTMKGLEKFKSLTWLNMDKNHMRAIEPGSFPPSLQTLSLSSNLFSIFPADYIVSSERIAWLYLRDNFINTLPLYNFKHRKKLEKLDVGENFLRELKGVFNGSLQVRDLLLDLNQLTSIWEGAFRGTGAGRINLSQNRLEALGDKVFLGVEDTLEYLDLGGNFFQVVPNALTTLNKLKYLYIPSNNISFIQNDTFQSFSSTLSALSLAGNKLEAVPSAALEDCKKLSHLNLGYNQIMEINEDDFYGLENLRTLLLMNNRIIELHAHTFRQMPNLRELSLSFNKISAVDPDAFIDMETTLESLEVSFGLYQEEFPEEVLKPLKSLIWLALDNNSLRSVTQSALYSFRNLQYLNLEGNRLSHIPIGIFHPSIHRDLRDIRLSFNHLISVDPHMFSGLPEVQSIVLSGNQINTIKTNAFRSLPSKLSVILSDNKISTISPRAFNDIATLVRLDLQSNELQDFSLSAFQNVTAPYLPLNLNLSRNQISNLRVADIMRPVCINTIDLTHNRISFVPKEFFESISLSLCKIFLGYNHITKLDEMAFSELPQLQVLTLQHNSIVSLRKRAFVGLGNLQILDLSHNHIEQLHMEQFKSLSRLRVVDLSFNHIRSIPRDAFQNTKLERLDLSNNEFLVVPGAALGEVGFTLRILDMSHNHIERLDSTLFPETPLLTVLNLCHNKLTVLQDGVFKSLTVLLRLELCGNRIRADHKELLKYSPELRVLNLGDTGIRNLPPLPPLEKLVSLNLSSNPLTSIASLSAPALRTLYISKCRIQVVPVWSKFPILKHLDMTYNPIKSLSKESFKGLGRLESLDLTGLDKLERLDSDCLSSLGALRSLNIQTWPNILSYGVGQLVRRITSLRRLSVTVTETRLSTLGGPLGKKLRHLEIKGAGLKELDSGALRGLTPTPELVLQIRDTSIEELPLGLLSSLRVTHLSLDLRNNRLTSLSPDILYYNLTSWENSGTKLISGKRNV